LFPAVELYAAAVAGYNQAIWPAQVAGGVLCAAVVLWAFAAPGKWADAVGKTALNLCWLWVAVVFFTLRLAPDLKWAYGAALVFAVEGTLLMYDAAAPTFTLRPRAARGALVVGALVVALGAIVYPVAAAAAGRGWPHTPVAGTAPAATAALTLGILVWSRPAARVHVVALPALYVIGFGVYAGTAFKLYEEFIPAAAGGLALAYLVAARRLGRGRRSP